MERASDEQMIKCVMGNANRSIMAATLSKPNKRCGPKLKQLNEERVIMQPVPRSVV